MEKRREVRQLRSGDVVELQVSVRGEVTAAAVVEDGSEQVRIVVRPMPCGEACGRDCDCQFAMFASLTEPAEVRLKGTQRVPLIGNLRELIAEQREMESRIALIKASYSSSSTGNGSISEGLTEEESP